MSQFTMQVKRVFSTIDAHAGGQSLRIVSSGVPPLRGSTFAQRRDDLRLHHDDIRRILLNEPRGHNDMYGAVLTTPSDKSADFGVIFLTNEGYSTMCGHGVIALTTALIETGTWTDVGPETRITYETPAGIVQARASVDQGRVTAVRFRNVPSFRFRKGLEVDVDGTRLSVDVAFGGAWYAIARVQDLGIELGVATSSEVAAVGMDVKRAVANAVDIVHPERSDLAGLYGTILVDDLGRERLSPRSTTVYADGVIDRSPCGTGTAALVACLAEDGEMAVGDTLVNESRNGAIFTGRITMTTSVAGLAAVVPEISGRGALTGLHQFVVDGNDPMPEGFRLP